MGDTVLYLRGPFQGSPEQFVTDRLFEDAKLLLDLPLNSFKSMQSAIATYEGFLDRDTLERLISPHAPEKSNASRIAKFIIAMDGRIRQGDTSLQKLANAVSSWKSKAKEASDQPDLLDAATFVELRARIVAILTGIPGLDRQVKAERLMDRIGQPLEQLDLICDLRPVFDESRTTVEGMILITTLRLVCKGADGLPVAFDAVLTERDVLALAKASKDAQTKLQSMKGLLERNNIQIPIVATERT